MNRKGAAQVLHKKPRGLCERLDTSGGVSDAVEVADAEEGEALLHDGERGAHEQQARVLLRRADHLALVVEGLHKLGTHL